MDPSSEPPLPPTAALASEGHPAHAQRLDDILSTLAIGVTQADLDGRFTYANPAALRILGVAERELIGRTRAELGITACEELEVPASPDADARVLPTLCRYVRPPAADRWLEARTAALHAPSGARIGHVTSFTDVTDRVQRQLAERAAAARMHDVLQLMAAGALFVDADGRIEYANPAAAALSGLKPEQVLGQLAADPAWQLTDETGSDLPYDALPVPTALRERRPVRGVELGVPTLSGVTRWMRVSVLPMIDPVGSLHGAVVTTEDVTERHALAEQLMQAQKIEGMGQLAGGIAHDFNNLLTVILGNAELALTTAPEGSTTATDIAEIREAANRGAALTRQMLTFARKQVLQPRPVHLDQLVGALERLLQRALGEGIVLQRRSDPELWPVKVDPGQLEQVLVNMAINARDAMPLGGSLSIETHNVKLEPSQVPSGVEAGEFVTVSITDTGTGMSHEVAAHIFDPFFTTKPSGRGTGLGLSICHGVVKQARGFITVDSVLGRGTTFRIHLPRCSEEVIDAGVQAELSPREGHGTVLLVEDQDSVRLFVARALRGYGYEVVSAASGQQALALQERMNRPLDLLLTDVVMPEMGGLELANALQARVPGLPVLYMTGYVDVRSPDSEGLIADDNLLLKPFTPMQLLQRVQRVLARSPAASAAPLG